ncbi:MAG: hypothetical protein HYZ38_12685 [Mycobacterium sp.]|nr:hypothetical protein [Mycobacterium sp.]
MDTLNPMIRWASAGTVAIAAAALVGCSQLTGGDAVCPGCGTVAEPSFPTSSPSVSSPAPSPSAPPTAPGTTGAAPGGQNLPANDQGYVYIETKSGKTRCQINETAVGCESEFENSPEIDGEQANGVNVTAGGEVRWVVGNLGDIPTVPIDYGTYSAVGWTIFADASGTRFTNDRTYHGMFVAVEGVQTF